MAHPSPSPSSLGLVLEPGVGDYESRLGITIEPPTPSPPPPAARQLPHSTEATPRESPAASETGARDEYPWELDESKRYPGKDPTRQTEFERRYPPDPPGAEAGDNARVWRVYRDRVNDLDADTISGWNDAINFLLIFAGLFSAVMTAFLIDISKKLEPDYAEYSAKALSVLIAQSAGTNASGTFDLNPNTVHVLNSTRAINGLWFVSLTLALIVSMFAILAKQWIVMFSTRMRAPVTHMRRWAQRHRVYRDGLDKWRLNEFISALSVAMHAAVFIFLVGLVVHLYALDAIIFGIVFGLTTLTFIFYVASTIAPLFHGTCPTLTPLLVHSHATIRGFRTKLGIYSPEPHAPFDEVLVLNETATQEGKRDGKVITWMVSHLQAGHDLDTVLDTFGSADLKCDLSHVSRGLRYIRFTTRNRLERLASYFGSEQIDSAEIARVLRSCIFLEDGSSPWPTGIASTRKLGNMRTHDIPALRAALELQLSQAARSADGDVTATAVGFATNGHVPPTPFLSPQVAHDGSRRRRLHGRISPQTAEASAQISFALETWEFGRQVRDDDPALRHILNVVSALARWNSQWPPLASPISVQTRCIILEKIIESVSQASSPLQVAQCAILASAFGHDESTAERCHRYITPVVKQLLKWNPTPVIPDWKLQALQVWARVFARYDRPRGEMKGRLTRAQVWMIYSRLLQMCRREEHWQRLTSSQVGQLLQPFDMTPPLEVTGEILSRTGHGALNLLVRCFPVEDQESNSPSELFARLAILVLHQALDFRIPDQGLREPLLALMRRMLPGGGDHSIDIRLPPGQSITTDNFATALSKRLGNVLLPQAVRRNDVTVSKSIWNLVSDYLQVIGRTDALIDFASQLAVELAILNRLDIDPSPMFNELLGRGQGAAFIIAPEAKNRAFVIARHARPFAHAWWEHTVRFLQNTFWNQETGFRTDTEFVDAVDRAPPCSGCEFVASRVLEEIRQSQLPSELTPSLSRDADRYPYLSSGISPSRLEMGPVAFEAFGHASPAIRRTSLPASPVMGTRDLEE